MRVLKRPRVRARKQSRARKHTRVSKQSRVHAQDRSRVRARHRPDAVATASDALARLGLASERAARRAGFTGFCTARELRDLRLAQVPALAGVYLVLRDPRRAPRFLQASTAGRFRGRDPSAPLALLRACWTDGAAVLYVGKAGGRGSRATLRSRLRAYLRFGAGDPVGHWGGRFVWQLRGAERELRFCWRPSAGASARAEARAKERRLIAAFERRHGRLPFANRRR